MKKKFGLKDIFLAILTSIAFFIVFSFLKQNYLGEEAFTSKDFIFSVFVGIGIYIIMRMSGAFKFSKF